jgi:hypothetical protein
MAGFSTVSSTRDTPPYDGNRDPCNDRKNDPECQPDQGRHVLLEYSNYVMCLAGWLTEWVRNRCYVIRYYPHGCCKDPPGCAWDEKCADVDLKCVESPARARPEVVQLLFLRQAFIFVLRLQDPNSLLRAPS